MDLREEYQVNNFAVAIGWSDADRRFYVEMEETDAPSDREPIRRSLKSPTNATRLLDTLSEFVAELTDVKDFYPSDHVVFKLLDAPKIQEQPLSVEDFLASPGRYMDNVGTIYPDGQLPLAAMPFRPDDEQAVASPRRTSPCLVLSLRPIPAPATPLSLTLREQ